MAAYRSLINKILIIECINERTFVHLSSFFLKLQLAAARTLDFNLQQFCWKKKPLSHALTREWHKCGTKLEGEIWPPDRVFHEESRSAIFFSLIELCSELCSF